MNITATAIVPKCWQTLIDVAFEDGLANIQDAKWHRSGIEDPNPYYDDDREISVKFDNGDAGILTLSNGQSNYFGGFTIYRKGDGAEIYHEIWEFFDDVADEIVVGSDTYLLKYEWI